MVSRRAGLLFTSFLVTVSTLMATLAVQVPTSNLLWFFVIVRGICGFGVGGEYPPSAAAGLEESDDVRKPKLTFNVVGRRYTGIIGFGGYVILGFIIGGTYSQLSEHIAAFVVLYGLLQAFGHMGPGVTIGLISSEAFPTAMRGMGYSVSTAFGRTGAAIGTECFTPLEQAAGKSSIFYLAGGVGVLGMIVYWFLPESGDLNLEEEDVKLAAYMAEHGYSMNTEI
uniref:Putative metabolite transport protein GIT1 n=1 Tax=Talaromyces marneffei PM1 TaxID=1077442 RepID=A0A093XSW5_TALMA